MFLKIIIYTVLALILFYLGSFLYMSIDSKRARETGLVNGRLRPCPGTPNCVLSEEKGGQWGIEPLHFNGEAAAAWTKMKAAVEMLGGRIEKESQGYLWATFQTSFWHFTDDLELRLDAENKVIQVRSASRVGKGDLGMNRKRVEKLRAAFNIGN
jgi:uncharacterized protein (DUF1499 family)